MTARLGRGIAAAAILIGVITILARVTGFAKQLVFARTVGANCLSTAYFTANQVPNIIFEVIAGGALAGMVVPVLAGAASRSLAAGSETGTETGTEAGTEARALVGRITSALLTWVLVVLVPLSVLTAFAAGPLIRLFTGDEVAGCGTGDVVAVATRMLVVFAPQIPLYGLAVVLYGVLQSYRRFTAPALAPLVSSLVVIVAYLAFPLLSHGVREPAGLPEPAELALSVGTTLGVLALVVAVIGPASRLRLPLRPTLRFPPGVARQVRRLAIAGLSALVAQQLAMAFVVGLANRQVGGGGLAAYNFAWAIYQVPYAVLAVPIATSAFPALSAHAEDGRDGAFAGLAAQTTRVVVVVSGLAAGVLAAVAGPVAGVFLEGMGGDVPVADFARSIALFAPGLVGYGLIAHLSRVLYACGRGRAAATGTVAGWVIVMVAQAAFAIGFPPGWKLGGLALGSAAGMTVGGALLLAAVIRARGGGVLTGVARAGAAAVLGGAGGFLAGYHVAAFDGGTGVWREFGTAILAAVAALVVGAAIAMAVDGRDLRAALSRIRTRGGPPGGIGPPSDPRPTHALPRAGWNGGADGEGAGR